MVPDGWRPALVSDVCSLKNGRGFTPKDWDTKGLPIIRIQNLNGGTQYNYFSGQAEDDWLVHPGQMLFAWAGTRGVSFGPTVWTGDTGVLNQHIFKVFGKGPVDEGWLYYCLQHVTDRIERKAHGFKSTLVHVRKSEIDNQTILLPPIPEQRRIASAIDAWDRGVNSYERLIRLGEKQRKGLLQRLLWGVQRLPAFSTSTGFIRTTYGRIPSGWQFPQVHEVATEMSERNTASASLPVLACSKHAGFVDSLEYFNKQVFSNDTSNYKIVRRGWYGFPSNHIEEGSLGYQDICDAGVVSPIYCVFRTTDAVHDGYFYRLLKTDHYRQIFAAATNASVDRRGSLRWKQFSRIHVPLPPLEEQKAIAAVCDAADRELDALRHTLENLKRQRRALMHQLLTGKRRVQMKGAA